MTFHVEDHGVSVISFVRTFPAEEVENTFVNRIRVSLDNVALVMTVITFITFVFSSFDDFLLQNTGLNSLRFLRLVGTGSLRTSEMILSVFTFHTSNGENPTWFSTVA